MQQAQFVLSGLAQEKKVKKFVLSRRFSTWLGYTEIAGPKVAETVTGC